MKTVLVSGCFDVLHGGHVQFLADARRLGDRLVVCVAGDDVIRQHKGRVPAMSADHRAALLLAMRDVDEVIVTSCGELGLDFAPAMRKLRPDVLAVTGDDRYREQKRGLCAALEVDYVVLPKRLGMEPTSTTEIRAMIRAPARVPMRVDFAGGWLDVPRYAIDGGYIVNCAVSPLVSPQDWPYQKMGAGLGGSAANAVLCGRDGFANDAALGCGWQDPAVLEETGLCVWRSGDRPALAYRADGHWLDGRMAIWWTGHPHDASLIANRDRSYVDIKVAGDIACDAAHAGDIGWLARAVRTSYAAQMDEGMASLQPQGNSVAWKYLGAGYGGYALYLFDRRHERDAFVQICERAMAVEPYCRWRHSEC